jgi:hypothetical protein
MAVLNTASAIRFGTAPVQAVYLGGTKVWPSRPAGYIATAGAFSNVGGTSFAIPVPAGVQDGDLCILVIGKDQAGAVTATSPGMTVLSPGVAAGSSYMQALSGPVSGTSVSYSFEGSVNYSAAAHFFHGLAVGTVGTAGVRSGTNTSLTVPGVTGSGTATWALVADRSQAATAEEQVDTITTSWGSSVGYYEGNPGINSGAGITSHWLVQGAVGQTGQLDVTFGDASPSAWGVCLTLAGA